MEIPYESLLYKSVLYSYHGLLLSTLKYMNSQVKIRLQWHLLSEEDSEKSLYFLKFQVI